MSVICVITVLASVERLPVFGVLNAIVQAFPRGNIVLSSIPAKA